MAVVHWADGRPDPTVLTFAAAVAFVVLALRPGAGIGIAFLFLLFVPIEKLFALRRDQRCSGRACSPISPTCS